MPMNEFNRGNNDEILKWKNNSRVLQIETIIKNTTAEIHHSFEPYVREQEAFGILMSTPPIYLEQEIRHADFEKETFLEIALAGFKLNMKMNYVRGIFEVIKQGVEFTASHATAVEAKIIEMKPPFEFKRAFSAAPLQLEATTHTIQNEALNYAFTSLQSTTPLLPRLRRDVAETMMNLKLTKDGEMEGVLPTKIEGVEIKYMYPYDNGKLAQFPSLSFAISPLKP